MRGLWTFDEGRCLETDPPGVEWKMLLDRSYLDLSIARAGADLLESLELAAVREGRWTDAEQAGLDSLWAKQTATRATEIMAQLRTGAFQ